MRSVAVKEDVTPLVEKAGRVVQAQEKGSDLPATRRVARPADHAVRRSYPLYFHHARACTGLVPQITPFGDHAVETEPTIAQPPPGNCRAPRQRRQADPWRSCRVAAKNIPNARDGGPADGR